MVLEDEEVFVCHYVWMVQAFQDVSLCDDGQDLLVRQALLINNLDSNLLTRDFVNCRFDNGVRA